MRMERFRHDRVLFAGDCAHGVSPFGARGANSGVQDADNLAWKLHYVIGGAAPDRLLDTYASEREQAADENIAHSTRSADFLTPKTDMSRVFRDAVLSLAQAHPFARRLVNSGRLSTATTLVDSPLATPDCDRFAGLMAPGAAAADAPVTIAGRRDWFLHQIGGRFVAVHFSGCGKAAAVRLPDVGSGTGGALRIDALQVVEPSSDAARDGAIVDADQLLASRYDAAQGTTYLFRPDQHVCARWRRFDAGAVRAAVARATCNG
jgi:3-(3-hydroxy-phenyl)propionate hydroxylase